MRRGQFNAVIEKYAEIWWRDECRALVDSLITYLSELARGASHSAKVLARYIRSRANPSACFLISTLIGQVWRREKGKSGDNK